MIPILNALQEHPESPCLWDKYISKILIDKFHFKACTHENYKMNDIRVVDDLIICNQDPVECDCLANELQHKMTFLLNFLGTHSKF